MFVPLPRIMFGRYWRISGKLQKNWDSLIEKVTPKRSFIKSFTKSSPSLAFWQMFWKYSEKGRHYHTPEHILDCLKEFEEAKDLAEHPLELQAGLIGHDVIYDTKAKDNEQQSANYMHNLFSKLGSSPDFSRKVCDLILLTKHDKVPKTIDEKIIVDIDLSILGADQEKFEKYDKNIRKEYSWVSDEDFKKGRAEVLQNFLDRENIYATEFFREKYEIQARNNLERVLKK